MRKRISFRNTSSSKSWSYRLYNEQIYRRLYAEMHIFSIYSDLEELRRTCIDLCLYTYGESLPFNYRAIQAFLYCEPSKAVKQLSKREITIIAQACGVKGARSVEKFSSIWLAPKIRGVGRNWLCVAPESCKNKKLKDYIKSDYKGVKSLSEEYKPYIIDLKEVGL